MNSTLRAVLIFLYSKQYIGAKHIPENRLLRKKTRFTPREEKKTFGKEYKNMLHTGHILRMKKKTGKGTDWHIALNPRTLQEVLEMIEHGET